MACKATYFTNRTKKKRKEEPKKTSDYLGQNLRNSSLAIRPEINQNLIPQSRSVISGSTYYPPLTTVRLFVYGEGMRSVGKNVVTTSGGKFIGKGTSEKLMCMYVNENGTANLSDLVPKHYIVGEVYEVPESKIEFLSKQDDPSKSSSKTKSNPRSASDDSDVRRG